MTKPPFVLRVIVGALTGALLLSSAAWAVRDNFPRILAAVLVYEGGYSNDAHDPGGPTNYGVTIIDARLYGREFGWIANPTAADVRNMPRWFANKVYEQKYWRHKCVRGDYLPSGLDLTLFDLGVNSGVGRSGKMLRRALNLPADDCEVTREVLDAIRQWSTPVLIVKVNEERLAFLQRLSTWRYFGVGWGRRVASVKGLSLKMAGVSGSQMRAFGEPPVTLRPMLAPGKAYEIDEEVEP